MSSILDEIKADTAETITAEARARGVSVDEYLKSLLPQSNGIDLNVRDIDESQAADLRARLKTFAEDWDRPEADVYDENPRGDVVLVLFPNSDLRQRTLPSLTVGLLTRSTKFALPHDRATTAPMALHSRVSARIG